MNMIKHDETWWVILNILWTTINNDEDVLGSKTADFETVATCVDTEVDWERIGGAAWDQRRNTEHNCARNCARNITQLRANCVRNWICCSSWFVLKATLRQSEQEHWRKHDIFFTCSNTLQYRQTMTDPQKYTKVTLFITPWRTHLQRHLEYQTGDPSSAA